MEFKWASRTAQPSMGDGGNGPEPPVPDRRWKGRCSSPGTVGIQPVLRRARRTCVLSSFLDLDGGSAGTSEALTAYLRGEERQGKRSGGNKGEEQGFELLGRGAKDAHKKIGFA